MALSCAPHDNAPRLRNRRSQRTWPRAPGSLLGTDAVVRSRSLSSTNCTGAFANQFPIAPVTEALAIIETLVADENPFKAITAVITNSSSHPVVPALIPLR